MDRGKRSILQASTILALPLAALVAFAAHGAQPSRKATVKKSNPTANPQVVRASRPESAAAQSVRPAAVQHASPTKRQSKGLLNGIINAAPDTRPIPAAKPNTDKNQVRRTGGLLDAFAGALKPKETEAAKPAPAPKAAPNWDGIPYHKPTRRTNNNTETPIRDVKPAHEVLAPAPVPTPPASAPPTIVRQAPAATLQARPASSRLPGGNSILVREESVASPSDLPKLPPPSSMQSSRRLKPAPAPAPATVVATPAPTTQAPSILSRSSSSRRAQREKVSPLDPSEVAAAKSGPAAADTMVVPKVSRRAIRKPVPALPASAGKPHQVPVPSAPLPEETVQKAVPVPAPAKQLAPIKPPAVAQTPAVPAPNANNNEVTKPLPTIEKAIAAPSGNVPMLTPLTPAKSPEPAPAATPVPEAVVPSVPTIASKPEPKVVAPQMETPAMVAPKATLSVPSEAQVKVTAPVPPPVDIPQAPIAKSVPDSTTRSVPHSPLRSAPAGHRPGPASTDFTPHETVRPSREIASVPRQTYSGQPIGSGIIDPSDNEAVAPKTAPTIQPIAEPLRANPIAPAPRLAQAPQLTPVAPSQPQRSYANPYAEQSPSYSRDTNRYPTASSNFPSRPKPRVTYPQNNGTTAIVASELPGIRVVTHGPKQIMIRQTHQFEIRVENRGSIDAEGVMVRAMIPDWAEVRGQNASRGSIAPQRAGEEERLVWTIDQLPAGSTERLFVRLRAERSGTHGLDVDWTLVPQKSITQVQVQEPQLKLTIEGPEEVVFGKSQSYRVRVLNPGDGMAPNVVFTLSPNSPTPQTQRIGNIPPGKEAQFEVELTAQDLGDLKIDGLASGDLELRASASKTIRVSAAKLEATISGPELKYQDTTANYQLTVRNDGSAASENIVASLRLPVGVSYVSGLEKAVQRGSVLQWQIDTLPPSASRSYQFACKMKTPGEQPFEFECKGSAAGEASVSIATVVESIADLVMTIKDPPAPAPVGEDVTYEITIVNRGSKAAGDVRAIAQFSHGIEPRRVHGHSGEILTGQVLFDPITEIKPGQQVRLRVTAKADRAGHHRFRSEIRSGDTVLVAEEATHYMSPRSERISRRSSDSKTR